LNHGGTPFASMPQVVRARDGALCALWALLAARLLSSSKEPWFAHMHRVATSTAPAHHTVGDPRAPVTALNSNHALCSTGRPCGSAPSRRGLAGLCCQWRYRPDRDPRCCRPDDRASVTADNSATDPVGHDGEDIGNPFELSTAVDAAEARMRSRSGLSVAACVEYAALLLRR
jgi:hypothetical protein